MTRRFCVRQKLLRLVTASIAVAVAVALGMRGEAHAQAYSWGGAGSSTTTNDYNSATNWSAPPAGAPPTAAGQTAQFGNLGSGTVVVAGAVTPDAWTFTAGGQVYVISGGSVTFGTAAGLTDNSSNDVTVRNNISGIGGVANAGTGTLTLTGTLFYTGLTSVTGGSIVLGDAANSVTLPGNATVNGGNLAVANGSLGAGTINVTGVSVVVGLTAGLRATAGSATINDAGTVAFQNSGSAGTSQITVTGLIDFTDTSTADNSVISVTAGGIGQFRSAASAGNSTITIGNTSSLTFAGNASGGTSRVIVDAGGQVDISLVNTGVTTGSIEGAGDIFLGSANLTVGGNNLSKTFSGTLQDGGVGLGTGGSLTKQGTGTLTLSGTNTYTGATTVNGGTLSVNGSIATSSGVIVNSGGILGGTGTVSSTVINSGGALAPGNSIGTLTVNGNLTLSSGAVYSVEVSPLAADRTNVTGTATLAGTVNAAYAPGSYISKQYTILNSTGGIAGTFSSLSNSNKPANIGAALRYDANNVYLNLTLIYSALGALGTNQTNVANALTGYFDRAAGIPAAFTNLSANGLSQISGETSVGVQQAVFQGADLFMSTVFDRVLTEPTAKEGGGTMTGVTAYADGGNGPRAASEAYAAMTPRYRKNNDFEGRWRAWATSYGGYARVSGDTAVASHDTQSRVYGIAAGAAYDVSRDLKLGFAMGGSGSSFSLSESFGSGRADSFSLALYGRHEIGLGYVAAALGYAWHDASTNRTVSVAGIENLYAAFHPQMLTARVELGRRYVLHGFGVTPFVGLSTDTLFLPSYTESAASGSSQFALSYESHRASATRGEFGARLDRVVSVGGQRFNLRGKAAWAHEWAAGREATATFVGLSGATFTIYGTGLAADAALVSVGADLELGPGWMVSSNYEGEFSRRSAANAGKLGVRYRW
ncbi:MAG: autotransporter domain-containing protein [Proteobacteria bacterium]|nr:autotransporter domain-containing protein [Pseudomonadota bacterium]